MPDMRDELVANAGDLLDSPAPYSTARKVIDSIPPGSFKREDGTWVRLVEVCRHSERCEVKRWTGEVDDCICDAACYMEVDHAE